MNKRDLARWEKYFDARDQGHGVERSALRSHISVESAYRFERGDQRSGGLKAAEILGRDLVGGQAVAQPLSPEAQKALDDFAYFRRRYFGRRDTPWQGRAGQDVLHALADKTKRSYLVINCPPGAGKSTLFTHDIPCWLIARDRRVRMMVGSASERMAMTYVMRIKNTLERESPLLGDADEVAAGIAFDAEATMLEDFGTFQPEGRSQMWRAQTLYVRQLDGSTPDDKEPTVTAWGRDSKFLGSRVHLAIWDDLETSGTSNTSYSRESMRVWLGSEAENRIEPGGAFILQGQRIRPDDLYRVALDKKRLDGTPKYTHVVYPAHDEQRCQGHDHDLEQRPRAWPDGCLLDPVRLDWGFLQEVANDDPYFYELMYQQRDSDVNHGLLEPVWVTGGIDSNGYPSPGCLDRERTCATVPPGLEDTGSWSFVTVDPSPTEWWGIIWWLYDPDTDRRIVMDIHRARLDVTEFLTLDLDHVHDGLSAYTGLLEDWRLRANTLRVPIRAVVFEKNGWQDYLIKQPMYERWQRATGIPIHPHTTHRNKADPLFGLESIGDLFRQGKIRLPHKTPTDRLKVDALLKEARSYTGQRDDTTDLLMSVWFGKLAVENLYRPLRSVPRGGLAPRWVAQHARRGAPGYALAVASDD